MNLDRGAARNAGTASHRIAHCLDALEDADGFAEGVDWDTRVARAVTVEELVGAIVAAELELEVSAE